MSSADDRDHAEEKPTDSEDHKDSTPTSTNLELRALIDNAHVGGIIGKGGANVKRVREDSGAFVSILKSDFRNVQERIMLLKGTPTQIAKAALLLAELLVESHAAKKEASESAASSSSSSSSSDTASIKLLVHKSQIGAIIGKAGAVIKETQTETGARVQVSNDPLPQSTDKTVNVTGTPQAVHDAIYKISVQLKDSPLRAGTKSFPYTPGVSYPHSYGGGGSHSSHAPAYHPPPPAAGATSGVTSTQKIAIPTVCCGCVIGRNGAVIRDLRHQSGTNISIADPDDNTPNERVVTLTGTPQGIQTAVYLIRQLVEQYQPNNSSATNNY